MRIAIALLLFAVTFESRSQHYGVSVTVSGDGYDVRVFDLATNESVFSQRMNARSEATVDVRDLHVTVRVGPTPYGVMATAEIEQGDMLVDSIHTVWTLKPHRAHLRAEGALRVGGDVRAPVVTRRVEPIYPEDARRERISGIVIIEALVDKRGAVRDVLVLKGLPNGLSEAAADAVKQWIFQPGTVKGEPVDVIFNMTVNFKLDVPSSPRIAQ